MRILGLVIVGLFSAAILAASCSDKGSSKPKTGDEIYASMGCTMCHGAGGEGSALGPPLAGAGARWKRLELIAYLKNPTEYAAKDARLAEQKKRFTMPMPPYASLEPEQLEALADFVLSRP